VSKWTPIWRGLQVAGHALFYLVMGLCLLAVLVLGVANLADRDRPKYWGTFTEQSTSCDPGPRGGCTATGIWTSDDGRIVRRDVLLDGSVEPGRSVRASYQPGGAFGDDTNNIVHTAMWSNAGLWMPWLFLATFGAVTWRQRRKWVRDAQGRRYVGRHTAPVTEE
jgi:hypothetical protein